MIDPTDRLRELIQYGIRGQDRATTQLALSEIERLRAELEQTNKLLTESVGKLDVQFQGASSSAGTADHAKIVCHAEGDRCLGCAHYRGDADVCEFSTQSSDSVPRETYAALQVLYNEKCEELRSARLAPAVPASVTADAVEKLAREMQSQVTGMHRGALLYTGYLKLARRLLEHGVDAALSTAPTREDEAGKLRAAVIEECAKVAEALPNLIRMGEKHVRGLKGSDVAEAIRALSVTSTDKNTSLPAESGSDRWPTKRGLEVPSGGSQPIPSELDANAVRQGVTAGETAPLSIPPQQLGGSDG